MVNPADKCLEDVIVRVFEEQEDLFFFPVTTQKQARSFIKALHVKGIQYEDICEEIGEFEHNFSAWRKGLGRAGIGNRIIELINKPFQELLLSDSEESDEGEPIGDTLNGRLQNVVKKSKTNGENVTRPNVEERLPLHQDREAQRKKQGEITDSWTKKIEDKMAGLDANKNEPVSEAEKKTIHSRDIPKKQEPKDDGFTLETVKLRPVARKQAENPVVMREKKESNFERTLSFREKLEKARQRESKTLSGSPKVDLSDSNGESDKSSKSSETTQTECEEVQNKEKEVKEDAESQVNLVELPEDQLDGLTKLEDNKDKAEVDQQEDKEEKHQIQQVEIIDLGSEDSGTSDEEVDGKDTESLSSSETSKSHEDDEDDSTQIDENYDSDFDQDSQDSATELGALLKRLSVLKEQSSDGPGFIYIFSDQCQSDNVHRVKIGASRFPNKRLEQAKQFNVELNLVSAVAVSPRQKALDAIYTQLNQWELKGKSGWFCASLDDLLSTVSQIAEKFPSESSDC